MSLKFQIITNDYSIIASDTRVSTTEDNEIKKIVNDMQRKLVIGDNFIIYFTGVLDNAKATLNELFKPNDIGTIDLSNARITQVMQKCNKQIINKLNLSPDGWHLGLSLTRLNDGKITEFQFLPPSFEAKELYATRDNDIKYSVIGIGANDFKKQGFELNPKEWWDLNATNNLLCDIREFYKYFNSEFYGGYLDIVQIHKTGKVSTLVDFERIPDKKQYNYIEPYNAHLSKGCTIDWGWIKDNGALDIANTATDNIANLADGKYANGTFISGTEIISPKISGAEMLGGEFKNDSETARLVLGADENNLADMTLSRISDDKQIFQVYDDMTNTALKTYGDTFIYTTGEKTYPQGEWDFTNTNVKGLKVTFG